MTNPEPTPDAAVDALLRGALERIVADGRLNAAQIPDEPAAVARRPGRIALEDDHRPGSKTSEFKALIIATLGTVATALGAAAISYVESKPEVVLLIVVDLLPWLIGLVGVYTICRTAVKVMEARR